MTLKRIQEIIAARFAQLNGERVARADDLADGKGNPIDQVLIAAIDRIVPLLMNESKAAYDKVIAIAAELSAVFARMVTKLRPLMEKLCAWSYQESALIFTRELPRSWLAAKVREKQRAMAEPETPLDKIHEMSKEQYEKLVKRYVFPPRSKADIAATMNRDVITVTSKGEQVVMNWEERILDLSRKVDPVKVAKEITESMELGESAHDLSKRLLAETKGIGASAKRIARTESMRQMGDSAEKSYEALGDIYVGMQFVATMDEVVRPEHAIFNGKIWYRDGRQPDISTMPRPPIAANCRCGTVSVLSTPKEALNDPNWLAQIQKAGEQAHPDAATMDEWWATTDEGRQKLSVGARRFEAVQKLVGNRATTWADFVQPNGRIMTIKELQAESDVDREKRRFAISAALQEQGRLRRQVTAMGFVV